MVFVVQVPAVEFFLVVLVVIAPTLIVVISMLVMALAMPLAISITVALRRRRTRRQQKYSQYAGSHPSFRSHRLFPSEGGYLQSSFLNAPLLSASQTFVARVTWPLVQSHPASVLHFTSGCISAHRH